MSRTPRFHETGRGSFFGDIAYERVLERHRNHFLVLLERLFDWEAKTKDMIALYKGKGLPGRAPYPPVVMFKMLFISYLYNVSERAMEEMADVNLLVKWFVGLAIDDPAPDHSTLTAFKRRLLGGNNWLVLQGVFEGMIRDSLEQGLEFGDLQVLDSVHTQANVNNAKDRERQGGGGQSRDPEARVINKGKRQVVEANGETSAQVIRYRGYKSNVSVNAKTGIVTAVVATPGNSADNKAFPAVRERDRSLKLPTRGYAGDKAFDDTDIYARLEEEGLLSFITLKSQRTSKKDPNKERWEKRIADPEYQAAVKQRYRVEQPFGIAKRWHGFEHCRYLGLARYRLQALLTFMVVNAKRMIKLLTGITFRAQAAGRRAERVTPVLSATSRA